MHFAVVLSHRAPTLLLSGTGFLSVLTDRHWSKWRSCFNRSVLSCIPASPWSGGGDLGVLLASFGCLRIPQRDAHQNQASLLVQSSSWSWLEGALLFCPHSMDQMDCRTAQILVSWRILVYFPLMTVCARLTLQWSPIYRQEIHVELEVENGLFDQHRAVLKIHRSLLQPPD